MIVIPAFCLLGGKVVRLTGDDPERAEVLADRPLDAARELQRQGALFFQLVDLDAVFGRGDNLDVVRGFQDAMIPCQYGGGVRSPDRVEEVFAAGADRVLIGTLFHTDPDGARALVERFGVRVMAALDVQDGKVRTHGRSADGSDLGTAVAEVRGAGVANIVYTVVAAPGTAPDIEAVRTLLALVGSEVSVFANCQARDARDVEALHALADEGLAGLVLGHSLFGSELDLGGVLA